MTGPYGQDPYGANPYGQQPYWPGQPQGQPPGQPPEWPGQPQAQPTEWAGQPQAQPTEWAGQPQAQPGPPPEQQQYPYPPPGGQYPSAPDPYGGYPQQFAQPGQQPPPGWPAGPYPPGPPPSNKKAWLVVAGIAVVAVVLLVVVLVVSLNKGDSTPSAGPSESTSVAPTSGQENTQQNATGCTPNVSGGTKPTGDTIGAGKLSFPASAAPGWAPFSDDQNPNLIDAVGLGHEVPGASQWMMQLEVAVTNFVSSMDVNAQASKLLECIANGPGYNQVSPTLGPKKTSSMTVDGLKAARVDADITIGDTTRGVKGDSVTIIAVDTKPVTIFLGATTIGDAASQATVNAVIAALKVSKK